jgi:hypothetical protein
MEIPLETKENGNTTHETHAAEQSILRGKFIVITCTFRRILARAQVSTRRGWRWFAPESEAVCVTCVDPVTLAQQEPCPAVHKAGGQAAGRMARFSHDLDLSALPQVLRDVRFPELLTLGLGSATGHRLGICTRREEV